MTRIAEPTTEPTITHPAWCQTDRCSVSDGAGVHWGADSTHEFKSPGGSRFDVLVALSRVVGDEQPSALYLDMGNDGECSIDQLDTFARWLTARVSEYRQAIATEDGAPTRAAHDHHDWCDTAECFLGNDEDGDYSSHFGVPTSITIDEDNCMPWRNVPSGQPEIQIRPIDFTGNRGVEISAGDNRTVESTSGSVGLSWLTPDEARQVAANLIACAELVEGAA